MSLQIINDDADAQSVCPKNCGYFLMLLGIKNGIDTISTIDKHGVMIKRNKSLFHCKYYLVAKFRTPTAVW